MANTDIFKDVAIDEDMHEQSLEDTVGDSKGNLILKGVVSLEELYDLQSHFKGPRNTKTNSSTLMYEQINLGVNRDPKFVNLGMHCTSKERQAFFHLFR